MFSSNSLVRLVPTRWGVGVSVGILVLAGIVKWHAGLMPENVSIPNPPPPTPNARDYYNRAEAAVRDGALVTRESRGFDDDSRTLAATVAAFTSPLDRHLVAENLPALTLARQGLRYDYQSPRQRSFDYLLKALDNDQMIALLLGMQSRRQAAGGDWAGAMSADLDGIEYGESLRLQAPVLEAEESFSRGAVGRNLAWHAVDHLTSRQAKAASKRLLGILSHPVPFSDTLTEEKWSTQGGILQMFRDTDWRSATSGDDATPTPLPVSFALHLQSPRAVYDEYTREADETIRRSQLNWPARVALPPQKSAADALIGTSDFTFGQCYQNDSEALSRMLLIELALRAYRLDRGAYPATLGQLVPAYLPDVPLDPFSNGQTLRYRLSRGRYLLYSVGPDAVDNGGQPVVRPKKDGGGVSRYPALLSSKGDLLAGAG